MQILAHPSENARHADLAAREWGYPVKRYLAAHAWSVTWLLMALIHLPALSAAGSAVLGAPLEATAWSRLGWTSAAFVFLVLKALNVGFLRLAEDRRSLMLFIVAAVLFHVSALLDVSVAVLFEWALLPLAGFLMLLSLGSVQHRLRRVFTARREQRRIGEPERSAFIPHAAPAILTCLAYVRRHTSLPPPLAD